MDATAKAPSIAKIIEEQCRAHPGDIAGAVEATLKELDYRPEVAGAEIDRIVREGVASLMAAMRHAARTRHKSRCMRSEEDMDATSLASYMTILDTWTAPNGMPLGDCLGGELPGFAAHELAAARGHGQSAAFYSALAKIVPERAKVRNRVDAAKANELLREAQA